MALHLPDIAWLEHAKPSPLIQYAFIASAAGAVLGALLAISGTILPYFFDDTANLFNLGLVWIAVAVLQLGIAVYAAWNYDRKRTKALSRVRNALAGRNYKELMTAFDVPMEELQWISNRIQVVTAVATAAENERR
jgi:hypothetical protein